MSEKSTRQSMNSKSTRTDRNAKVMITPTPSLPKEEFKERLESVSRAELEKLQQALQEEKARSKEYLERQKYLQADFENSMKRLKRDLEENAKFSSEQLILKLIDVAENLERALEASEKIGEKSELTTGVRMIHKELDEILEQEGLEEIPSEGQQFNPTLHEALSQIETDDKAEGTIVKELKRGYKLKGKLIRPSKVEIAKKRN